MLKPINISQNEKVIPLDEERTHFKIEGIDQNGKPYEIESILVFMDDEGNVVDRGQATKLRIIEIDQDGQVAEIFM